MGLRAAVLGCGIASLLCAPAFAQQTSSSFRVSGEYVTDVLANASGGIERGVRVMGKADLIFDAGSDDGGLYVNLQHVHGGSLTDDLIGDAQTVSNIDAPSALRPLEAYVRRSLGAERQGEIRFGLIDLNGIFDVQEVGGLFLHSSHGIGPDFSQSGLNGPSIFPTTSSALTVTWAQDQFAMRLGVFDAVAGDPARPSRTVIRLPGETGFLVVGEVDVAFGENMSIQLGGWAYTDRFDAIEKVDALGVPARVHGNRGAYALVEGEIGRWRGRALDGWLRVGVANDEINPISSYVGGGVVYGDEELRAGIGVAHARLGGPARRAGAVERAETTVELTIAANITDRIVLQPDVQYVINPGWDPDLENAVVAGVRLQISLF